MPQSTSATLDKITDFPALVDYLRDELEWPIAAEIGLDEATFDVIPEEIGLKSSVVGGGIEIKQLRPLNRAQPWGVFFLNLPSAKLPVTLVRNILGKLAIKKRASANKSEQAAFAKHDLLFIAATGSAPDRRLAFAHFADDDVKDDAATLKVLGWDADDTPRRLGLTEASLKTKLHWPDDPADADHWRKQWGEAFAHADTRTVVRDSKTMAKALAALARRIRDRANELIAAQTATGSLVKLHKAFKEALIHDLTPEGFADTYAQTIAYGLLSTAISRASGALTQDDMAANVAGTSPFLKEMLGTFIKAGGRKSGKAQGLDFDELGITDVVELLRNADMEAVLADFDRKNPDEDPVIHFYELFLKEYDAAQKVKRGVFYTPRPVVGFIVRSVDKVLRTEFGLEDGLASTATWGEVIATSRDKGHAEITLPKGAKVGDSFVRILDPATGTGTFLVECVDLIHKTMVKKWKAAGKRKAEIEALWNAYVPHHLLPRLTGFELMMAPYAIAHVKLGLKLADTGYTFGSDARAQIYLTNALEPAQDMDMQLAFVSEALAQEAKAANEAKEWRFTVVVANPPYSLESGNLNEQHKTVVQRYRSVDGSRIKERAALQFEKVLNDDYVKFTAFSESIIRKAGVGCTCLITSHSFIDSLFLRGMRAELLKTYNKLFVLDLHGNSAKKEEVPGDGSNQNVFDIQQGVAITLGTKAAWSNPSFAKGDNWGTREEKYAQLSSVEGAVLAHETLIPSSPKYLFVGAGTITDALYESFPAVSEAFEQYGAGFITARDNLVLDIDAATVTQRVSAFAKSSLSDAKLLAKFEISDKKGWSVSKARARLSKMNIGSKIVEALYRPFDYRALFYDDTLVWGRSHPTMKNLIGVAGNISLVTTKVTKDRWDVGCTIRVTAHKAVSAYDTSSVFPLFLMPDGAGKDIIPNYTAFFPARVSALTGLTYDDCIESPKQGAPGCILPKKAKQAAILAPARRERGERGKSFGPRDLFDYMYAVLHSPAYRARYTDYLKSDFARIPLPASRALFEALVPLGTELVALHLLDADALPILKDPKGIRLAGSGEARIAHKPEFDPKLGRVTINATRWFESVSQVAWDSHIGGYQPAQKWLTDRAAKGGKKASDGRVLTDEDILHYRRMIGALTRIAELMPQVDVIIERQGGWPAAFRGITDKVQAKVAE